jgi:hypothetical protein
VWLSCALIICPTVRNVPLSSAEIYNPSTGRFRPTGGIRVARKHHTATLLRNGQVLLAGGEDNNGHALESAELYNPGSAVSKPSSSIRSPPAISTSPLGSAIAVWP